MQTSVLSACLCLILAGIVTSADQADASLAKGGAEEELTHKLYVGHPLKKRWVLAKLVDLNRTVEQLRAMHDPQPPLSWPYSEGLPQSSLTYDQRYEPYKHPIPNLSNLNSEIPDARHVLLVRIAASTKWTKDFILNVRAIAIEVHRAGWHVWLYHQDSLAPHDEEMHSPVRFLNNVPKEFHGLLQNFDAQQLHAAFPHAHLYRDRAKWGQSDFQWREYLGPTYFMERFRAYEFAFVVEHDVRYTGEDWGRLLNNVIQMSSRALGHSGKISRSDGVSFSRNKEHNPDFVIFSPFLIHPDSTESPNSLMDNSSWQYPNAIKYFINMYGMSRKYNQFIVEQSQRGNAGFAEQFLPAVALNEEVNAVTISLGLWYDEHPMHCCMSQMTEIYDSWYLSGHRLTSLLLHPVKNANISVWNDE